MLTLYHLVGQFLQLIEFVGGYVFASSSSSLSWVQDNLRVLEVHEYALYHLETLLYLSDRRPGLEPGPRMWYGARSVSTWLT